MYAQNPHSTVFYQLTHLTVIEVSGVDASQFLQGQLTCNINELTESKTTIAAFCNAKGRVISTLIVAKTQNGFWLILPESLAETVRKKLQMYVLRAKVKLCLSTDLKLYGASGTESFATITLPQDSFECSQNQNMVCIKMPCRQPRFLFVVNTANSEVALFRDTNDVTEWRYQDISSGFPWFDASQSEHYIPQMLNIDQLGGISFNKGCYTGQEIVARTHYLGKSKRQLNLAECNVSLPPDAEAELAILDAENKTKCGDVVTIQTLSQNTRMLIVLQTVDDSPKNLILNNQDHTPINLIAFQ